MKICFVEVKKHLMNIWIGAARLVL